MKKILIKFFISTIISTIFLIGCDSDLENPKEKQSNLLIANNTTKDVYYSATYSKDHNGDGKTDLIWYCWEGNKHYTYLSDGDGNFTTKEFQDGINYDGYHYKTGDFNGDGKTDFLWYHGNGSPNYFNSFIYFSNGDGTFATRVRFQDNFNFRDHKFTTGDFNGDGKTDLVWYNGGGYPDYFHSIIYFSNGDGTFTRVLFQDNFNFRDHKFTTGDFNGDGKTDFLWYNGGGYPDYFHSIIYFSNGDGTFTRVLFQDNLNFRDHKFTTGDFNGDGRTDFSWHLCTINQYMVYISNGDGTFTRVCFQDNIDYTGYYYTSGDYNGDGRTDFIWYKNSEKLYTYLSNGDGTFTQPIVFKTNYHELCEFQSGDYNGDGKTDFIWFEKNDELFYTYFGSADGTFKHSYENSWNYFSIFYSSVDNEGNTAIDSNDNIITAWYDYGDLFIRERRNGLWNNSKEIIPSPYVNFYFPKVIMNNNGNAVIVWNGSLSYMARRIYISHYSNGSWEHPKDSGDYIFDCRYDHLVLSRKNIQVAMDNSGNFIILWVSPASNGNPNLYMKEYRNGSWLPEVIISNDIGMKYNVFMDDNGYAIILYTKKAPIGNQIVENQLYIKEYSNGSWSTDECITISEDSITNPQINMKNGDVVIAWNGLLAEKSYIKERRNDSWLPIKELFYIYPKAILLDDYGNSFIKWTGFTPDRMNRVLYMSEYRNGSWTHPENSEDYLMKVDKTELTMDENGDAFLLWRDKDNNKLYIGKYRDGLLNSSRELNFDHMSPDSVPVLIKKNGDTTFFWKYGGTFYMAK